MSGKLDLTTNKYASLDATITDTEGVVKHPFLITRLLDIVRNDGPGEAIITLDAGSEIPLTAGDYIGPWTDFHCSDITIQCVSGSCRVRALGV